MLSSGELAKLFCVSSQTIINWLDGGRMTYQRIGNGPRKIKEQEIFNFIKKGNPDGSTIPMDTLDQNILNRILKAVGEQKEPEPQVGLDLESLSSDDLLQVIAKANRILKERTEARFPQSALEAQTA